MEKPAFNQKGALFSRKMDLEVRKKLVKCYIWIIALYGAETWTLRALDQTPLESLKCGAEEEWRRSVGRILCGRKKYYLESKNTGISYVK
jgi:hypothetical protein